MKHTLAALALVTLATGAMAQFRLLGETDTSTSAGFESALWSYNTYNDVVANNGSGTFTQIDWNPDYHTGELAFDGKYRLLGETNTAASAGTESAIYTYDSYADLVNNNWSSWSWTQIDWDPKYHTVGLEYDGKYRLMGETDTTAGAGVESVMWTYDTYADLLANNGTFQWTNFDWNPSFHTGGLAFDGKYRLYGEQDTTTNGAGSEGIIFTYDTYADLMANNWSNDEFTQVDWEPRRMTRGFTYESVPEPATFAILGLGALALRRRRR